MQMTFFKVNINIVRSRKERCLTFRSLHPDILLTFWLRYRQKVIDSLGMQQVAAKTKLEHLKEY